MKIKRFMKTASEIPVASMSDIAFLLIVFFMIVAVFAIEAGFMLKLPDKDKPPIKLAGQKIIEVSIAKDNSLMLDNQATSLDGLSIWLDTQTPQTSKYVSIKAHGQSTYQTVVEVVEQFKRRGFDKISLKRQKS